MPRLVVVIVALLGTLVAAVCGSACADEEPSPRERCAEEAIGECCDDSECGGGSLCDFDYICSPGPDGVSCSEPSGDRLCHPRCEAAEEGQACPDDAGTCARIERFQGGDAGEEAFVCR